MVETLQKKNKKMLSYQSLKVQSFKRYFSSGLFDWNLPNSYNSPFGETHIFLLSMFGDCFFTHSLVTPF